MEVLLRYTRATRGTEVMRSELSDTVSERENPDRSRDAFEVR